MSHIHLSGMSLKAPWGPSSMIIRAKMIRGTAELRISVSLKSPTSDCDQVASTKGRTTKSIITPHSGLTIRRTSAISDTLVATYKIASCISVRPCGRCALPEYTAAQHENLLRGEVRILIKADAGARPSTANQPHIIVHHSAGPVGPGVAEPVVAADGNHLVSRCKFTHRTIQGIDIERVVISHIHQRVDDAG